MNYKAIYDALIERARQRELKDVYFEKHHVIPKCMGGSNKKDNMVQLLAREHFIAHEFLIKIYPENYELICALNLMCNFDKYVMTSRKYEWVRIKFAEQHSKRMSGENNGMFGKTHSPEMIAQITIKSLATKARKKLATQMQNFYSSTIYANLDLPTSEIENLEIKSFEYLNNKEVK